MDFSYRLYGHVKIDLPISNFQKIMLLTVESEATSETLPDSQYVIQNISFVLFFTYLVRTVLSISNSVW